MSENFNASWEALRSCAAHLGFSWECLVGKWVLRRQVGTTNHRQVVGRFDTEHELLRFIDGQYGLEIASKIS